MKILLEQDHIDSTPEDWSKQYNEDTDISKQEITARLNSLEKPLIKEEVDEIIGNDSWTSFGCNNCYVQSNKLIYIESARYEGYRGPYIYLCKNCLEKALKIIGE